MPLFVSNCKPWGDLILKIAFRFYRADVNVNCNLMLTYRIRQKSGKYVDCSELNISRFIFVRAKLSNSQRPKLAGLTVVSRYPI